MQDPFRTGACRGKLGFLSDSQSEALTHFDDIGIPQDTSAEFSARVVHGSISVSGLQLRSFDPREQEVSGTLGEGDGLIDLSVVNGDVLVSAY